MPRPRFAFGPVVSWLARRVLAGHGQGTKVRSVKIDTGRAPLFAEDMA